MKFNTPLQLLTIITSLLLVTAQSLHAETIAIETVAEFTDTRPGNIAVTPQGRIIMTQQPLDGPTLSVVEVLPNGSKIPFPNKDWADGPESGDVGISAVIGVTADSQGIVWLLDMGSPKAPAQIIAWDTLKNRLHQKITISKDVITPISFLQDFALDEKRGHIYIADMTFPPPGTNARPAFIVIDIKTGKARRLLESANALMPVKHNIIIENSLVGTQSEAGKSIPWHLGLNPIAIDPSFEWLYFGTVNGSDVFRVPAEMLANESNTEDAIIKKIENYAKKPPSDGIVVDEKGRVFISDIEASAVGISTPKGYNIIAQDKTRLSWPDGFALSQDGTLYVTQNQLHAHPALNEGKDDSKKPYRIIKIKL